MPENVVINRRKYGWGSISITRGGVGAGGVFGFSEISYSQSAERGEARGHGRFVLGYTRGNVSQEGSLTLLYEDWIEYRAALGPNPLDKSHDLAITREEGDSRSTDELRGVLINNVEKSDSNSPDASMVTLGLSITQIVEDGAANFEGEVA